ncbi:MAG: hypothetical protein V1659_05925 [Candidatus Woesearchaeota archaeon]
MEKIHDLLSKAIMSMKSMQGSLNGLKHRFPQIEKTPEFQLLQAELNALWQDVNKAKNEL